VFGGYGSLVFGGGLIAVLYTFWTWWSDVIKEAHAGDHTPVVSLHLRYGMILFIASEVMFFVGWFWAFFDFSLFPVPLESSVIGRNAADHHRGQRGAGPKACSRRASKCSIPFCRCSTR
jgi:cytochrome c oxidase subunit 3